MRLINLIFVVSCFVLVLAASVGFAGAHRETFDWGLAAEAGVAFATLALGAATLYLASGTREANRIARDQHAEEQRRAAYAAYLTVANESAHRLGNLAENGYGPASTDSQAAAYYFDSRVTPRLRAIELVGTDEAAEAARTLHEQLRAFRDRMTLLQPPPYKSADYDLAYEPVYDARNAFVDIARSELVRD